MARKKITSFKYAGDAIDDINSGITTQESCLDTCEVEKVLNVETYDLEDRDAAEQYADRAWRVSCDVADEVTNIEQEIETLKSNLAAMKRVEKALNKRHDEAQAFADQFPENCSKCGQPIREGRC